MKLKNTMYEKISFIYGLQENAKDVQSSDANIKLYVVIIEFFKVL